MTWFADLPLVLRHAAYGGTGLGILGALTGLVIGLAGHPPTAWFAALEVGYPAAFLGVLLGTLSGAGAWVARTVRQRSGTDRNRP